VIGSAAGIIEFSRIEFDRIEFDRSELNLN
jgi:hypothetical protein